MSVGGSRQIEDFSRYEFKYILSRSVRDAIESEIQNFMRYDGFVHPEMNNSYFVRSLYFDNPQSTNFYGKIDGIKKRKKFRLRTYDKVQGTSPIFFEQKGRNVNRVFKHRVRLNDEDLSFFGDSFNLEWLVKEYEGVKFIDEFIIDVVKNRISPVVLVDYVRTPYVSDYDTNFRLTFDSHISTTATNDLFEGNNGFYDCLSGYTILEAKFHRKIPAWFHKIILAHNLERLSVSKFVLGMKTSKIAIDIS